MKKYLFILAVQLYSINACKSQSWKWVKQIGGNGSDGCGIRNDSNDNIYCYGSFEGTLLLNTDTLYAFGSNDIFLAKYDNAGNEIWVKSFGGNNPNLSYNREAGISILIDNQSSCFYLSGYFFGLLTIDSNSVLSAGECDHFLAKFDFSGNCQWLKRAGGFGIDYGNILCFDPSGDILWTTYFLQAGTIDTFSVDKGTYLTKMGSNGTVLSVKKLMQGANILGMDFNGSEYILCGHLRNDTIIIQQDTLYSPNYGALLMKLDTAGKLIWIKIGSDSYTDAVSISMKEDINGNIYIAGTYHGTLKFDNDSISNANNSDAFLAKFSLTGTLLWIRQASASGSTNNRAMSIDLDADGNVYVTGYFSGTATFGNFTVVASSSEDMFLARYDTNGDCIGVKNFGEAGGFSLKCRNTDNSVYVSGIFKNTVTIGSTTLTSNGDYDMFIAKSDAITDITEGQRPTNDLIIYANPTTGKCNVTIPAEFINEINLTLQLFDNNGKLLQQTKVVMNENKIKLNLEQQAKGLYQVTLSNGKKQYSGKIVFE